MNTERTKQIIQQINGTTDAESLNLIVVKHVQSISNLIVGVNATQQEILSNIIPILTPPSPTPQSIVSWLSKLTTGIAIPQLKAQIRLTKQLAELSFAVAQVSSAVANARSQSSSVTGPLKEAEDDLQVSLSTALSNVSQTQSLLNQLTGTTLSNFDTSSVTNFLSTADQQISQLDQNASQYIAS